MTGEVETERLFFVRQFFIFAPRVNRSPLPSVHPVCRFPTFTEESPLTDRRLLFFSRRLLKDRVEACHELKPVFVESIEGAALHERFDHPAIDAVEIDTLTKLRKRLEGASQPLSRFEDRLDRPNPHILDRAQAVTNRLLSNHGETG